MQTLQIYASFASQHPLARTRSWTIVRGTACRQGGQPRRLTPADGMHVSFRVAVDCSPQCFVVVDLLSQVLHQPREQEHAVEEANRERIRQRAAAAVCRVSHTYTHTNIHTH